MAGTVTRGLFAVLPPIITPVLLDPDPWPLVLVLPVARKSRALERAIGRDDDGALGAFVAATPPEGALYTKQIRYYYN